MSHKNLLLNSKVLQNALEVPQRALEYTSQLHNVYFCLLRWTIKVSFLILVAFHNLITTQLVRMKLPVTLWIWPASTAQMKNKKLPMFLPQKTQTYQSGHAELGVILIERKVLLCLLFNQLLTLECVCQTPHVSVDHTGHTTCSGKLASMEAVEVWKHIPKGNLLHCR